MARPTLEVVSSIQRFLSTRHGAHLTPPVQLVSRSEAGGCKVMSAPQPTLADNVKVKEMWRGGMYLYMDMSVG
jgi:hypothetical protein